MLPFQHHESNPPVAKQAAKVSAVFRPLYLLVLTQRLKCRPCACHSSAAHTVNFSFSYYHSNILRSKACRLVLHAPWLSRNRHSSLPIWRHQVLYFQQHTLAGTAGTALTCWSFRYLLVWIECVTKHGQDLWLCHSSHNTSINPRSKMVLTSDIRAVTSQWHTPIYPNSSPEKWWITL